MNANTIFSANALANFPGTLAPDGGGFDMASSVNVSKPGKELVVIDAGVADKATLIADFESRGVEYVVLEGDADGVSQITAALAGRSDLDALHIISHGSEGEAHLGDVVLSESTLNDYSDDLADWGEALGLDGDILFYGCNLAEGPGGTSFINEISALTGADVAASDDLTGAAHLGGDFDLEVQTGTIEADIALSAAAQADFDEVLNPGGVSAGLQLWVKGDAGTGTTTDGAAINTWSDQSGNSNDVAVTAAGREPTYSTGNAGSNFNSTVVFDGLNDGLELAPFMTGAEAGGSVFGAAANNTPGTGFDNLVVFGIDNPHLGTASGTGKPLGYMNGSSPIRADHPADPVDGQFHVWGWEFDIAPEPSNTLSNTGLDVIFDGEVYTEPNIEVRASQFANGAPNADQFQIGSYEGIEVWDGPIGEIVVFDRNLTAAESQRVNSYISLKWGTTLDNDPASGTVNYDYVDSNGTVVWAGTSNAAYQTYHNDIAGIGRDDASVLDQQKSNSVNSDSVVTIENSSGTFTADNSFLVWGNNDQDSSFSLNYSPNSFAPTTGYFRMGRVWKVQETGTVETVTVSNDAAEHLLVSNDPTFTTGVTEIALSGGSATVDFTDGQYFTFGASATAPGGVAGNLAAWYKAGQGAETGGASASDGTSVDAWRDQSLNSNDALQGTASLQPEWVADNGKFNFNPSVTFVPDARLQAQFSTDVWDNPDGTIYVIYNQETVKTGWRNLVDFGLTSTDSNNPQVGMSDNDRIATWMDGFDRDNTPFQPQVDETRLIGYDWQYDVGGHSYHYDGESFTGSSTHKIGNAANAIGNFVNIGGDPQLGEYFPGQIAEIAIYSEQHDATERAQVQSYFALKYGTTLDSDPTNSTANFDYVDSSNATIWSGNGANNTYHNDVAGIGRDDAADLDQQKSQSVNGDGVVTIDNGGAFTTDKSFMVWGNNDASTSFETSYSPTSFTPTDSYFHMSRIWTVQETGTVGTVTLTGPSNAGHLLVDDDGDFSNGGTTEIALTNGSATVDLNNGEFFTFGREIDTDSVVWGIRNNTELGYLNPNNNYSWTARRTLTEATDAFALVDSTTGIGIQADNGFVLIDLDTGAETLLTPTNSFTDLGDYQQGTYDAATNTFYAAEEQFREFQIFSVDPVANTIALVEERQVGTNNTNIQGDSDDWVLIDNKLYGIDNNGIDLEIIDLSAPANSNLTQLDVSEIASTTGNNEISGVWEGADGLIHVLDDSGTVFALDPSTNAFAGVIETQTPNGSWSNENDDFGGLAPIPPIPANAVWGVRNRTELGYLDPNANHVWTAVSTLSEDTDAFALLDSTNTKAIGTQTDRDIVLIDLPSGTETVLTPSAGFPTLPDLTAGTYASDTNQYYALRSDTQSFFIFTVDSAAGSITFEEERSIGTGGSGQQFNAYDMVIVGGKLFGVDSNILEVIDLAAPANSNLTELTLPANNGNISGMWATDTGALRVLDETGEVFEVDPNALTITQIQAQTPNGNIWSTTIDDIGSVGTFNSAPIIPTTVFNIQPGATQAADIEATDTQDSEGAGLTYAITNTLG